MLQLQNETQASGKKSALFGARHQVGLTINASEILSFLHDCVKDSPVPYDANFLAIRIEEHGAESQMELYFESKANPLQNCICIKPMHLIHLFIKHSQGMIPADAEIVGIEVSTVWQSLLLFVLKSDKFPQATSNALPIASIRYQAGTLHLYPPKEALAQPQRNIVLADTL